MVPPITSVSPITQVPPVLLRWIRVFAVSLIVLSTIGIGFVQYLVGTCEEPLRVVFDAALISVVMATAQVIVGGGLDIAMGSVRAERGGAGRGASPKRDRRRTTGIEGQGAAPVRGRRDTSGRKRRVRARR